MYQFDDKIWLVVDYNLIPNLSEYPIFFILSSFYIKVFNKKFKSKIISQKHITNMSTSINFVYLTVSYDAERVLSKIQNENKKNNPFNVITLASFDSMESALTFKMAVL